jgi:hypothetical protein
MKANDLFYLVLRTIYEPWGKKCVGCWLNWTRFHSVSVVVSSVRLVGVFFAISAARTAVIVWNIFPLSSLDVTMSLICSICNREWILFFSG